MLQMMQIAKGNSTLLLSMFPDVEWLLAIMAKLFVVWGTTGTPGETVHGYACCLAAIIQSGGRQNMTANAHEHIQNAVCR